MTAASACMTRQFNIQILIISGFASRCVLKWMCSEFPPLVQSCLVLYVYLFV